MSSNSLNGDMYSTFVTVLIQRRLTEQSHKVPQDSIQIVNQEHALFFCTYTTWVANETIKDMLYIQLLEACLNYLDDRPNS